MCYKTPVQSPFAWYREFVPCEALRADVYAFFFIRARTSTGASVSFVTARSCVPQNHRVCAAVRRWTCVDQVRGRTDVRRRRALAGRFERFGRNGDRTYERRWPNRWTRLIRNRRRLLRAPRHRDQSFHRIVITCSTPS
jgi:hypothetical protein